MATGERKFPSGAGVVARNIWYYYGENFSAVGGCPAERFEAHFSDVLTTL